MKNLALFLNLLLCFGSVCFASENGKICGGTVQTFWKLNMDKTTLKKTAIYRHSDVPFCERSILEGSNAKVRLLDKSKNQVRELLTFIPIQISKDFNKGGQLSGALEQPNAVSVQIKFSDDEEFKKVRYLEIVLSDGKTYGPTVL